MGTQNWDSEDLCEYLPSNYQDISLPNSQDIAIQSQDFDGMGLLGSLFEAVQEAEQVKQENNCNGLLDNQAPNLPVSEFITLDQHSLPVMPTNQDIPISAYEAASTAVLPTLENFEGQHTFSALFEGSSSHSWVYSEMLDQVFIDMNRVLMMEFRTKYLTTNHLQPLFIRAVAVYPNPDDRQEPVNRCIIHTQENDPQSIAHENGNCLCGQMEWVGHVVRADCDGAVYCYNRNSKRHSVLIPVAQDCRPETRQHIPFRFMCKTSCTRGMMRRPIRLVFTLESFSDFKILGRQSILVKICSCPKRDKDRQEKDFKMYSAGNVPDVKVENPLPTKRKARLVTPAHHPLPVKMTRRDDNTQQPLFNICSPNNNNFAQEVLKRLQMIEDKVEDIENQAQQVRQQINDLKQTVRQVFEPAPP